MNDRVFIFSNKPEYRLSRHLVFWLVGFFSQPVVGLLVPALLNQFSNEKYFEFGSAMLFLPGQLFLTYSTLYFLIPKFILKRKYYKGLLVFSIFIFITGMICAITYTLLFEDMVKFILGISKSSSEKVSISKFLTAGFVSGLRSALPFAGFAAAIKLMKSWYINEYSNTILQKEKLNAELSSLKAQVQPHFLFNTLNNIYSLSVKQSPVTTEMIGKLSGLLRYILYECNVPKVNLTKELKLIEDYISIEKIRYDNKLDISFSSVGNPEKYLITPLLLLPFAENCFKHGSSKMIDHPWINISVDVADCVLNAKFINGKSTSLKLENESNGIGITNVERRLKLLYPDLHELSILSEEDVFVVSLKIKLDPA